MIEKLRADLKNAMKQKDQLRMSVLRMVLAAVRYAEGQKQRALADEDVIAVIQKAVKMRQDSVEQFEKAGRDELVARESQEIEILQQYLPQQLDEAATAQIVDQVIAEVGATSMEDMGAVMKEIMSAHRGEVDGRTVQQIVTAKLKG